jgi:acetolactate decarboxylase
MAALLEGIYEGNVNYGDLRKHGDFGLGTFNDLDGEIVGFDGVFYQLRSDGAARPVAPEQRTPFAVVAFFRPELEIDVLRGMAKEELLDLIEKATDANLFTAIRIDGLFDQVHTRTVQRQKKPFAPLAEAAAHETTNSFANVQGTFAGFRSPPYLQGIGVAGFHLHFLRQDKQAGGHALDYRIQSGKVQIATLHGFHVELPNSGEFMKANLGDAELDDEIKASEG